jgi:hypothetical protein
MGIGGRILRVREGGHPQPVIPLRDQFFLRQMPQVQILLAEELVLRQWGAFLAGMSRLLR